MIARIGPWVEPEDAEDVPKRPGRPRPTARAGWMQGDLRAPRPPRRKRDPEPVEEHIYRSCDARSPRSWSNRLAELVRKVQPVAIEQTWPVEWAALSDHRRIGAELREKGNLRHALHEIGEAIELLGTAGRQYRKANA